jgi:hypothetical protein
VRRLKEVVVCRTAEGLKVEEVGIAELERFSFSCPGESNPGVSGVVYLVFDLGAVSVVV